MAVNYASFREQFGRKIGSFQAIAHYCANMAMSAEVAWAETAYAGLAWQGRAGDYASHVAASRLLASTAALENARLCIQVHGGMGYSSECDAHLFLKRGHALAVLFGPMREAWSALLSLNDNILNLAAE
jgi:alkylation response protein AidB-like acyl-CoA dehydrogenase